MNDLKNLRYKIPQPLKEITESIASCIHGSPFCQYSSADIATAIVTSAIQNKSQNAVARSPDSDTVFWRIYKGLTLEKLKKLIATQKPPKGTHITILLDANNDRFYGKDALGLVGAKPKNGTSQVFSYLVAFSTTQPKGMIAIRELFDGSVTNDAMKMVKELYKDYIIDIVIMDGEFYKAEFAKYLIEMKIHFIVRRTNTGNIRDLKISYGKSYFYKKDIERKDGKVIHLEYWIYKYKGKKEDFYLCSDMKKSPRKIRKMFRTRWEIETGFRERNRVEIKTTTRDFLVRLFFYIVGCMVYNIWQKIRFRYSTFVIEFDDIIDCVKRYIKQLTLSSSDILSVWRKHCIRLRII